MPVLLVRYGPRRCCSRGRRWSVSRDLKCWGRGSPRPGSGCRGGTTTRPNRRRWLRLCPVHDRSDRRGAGQVGQAEDSAVEADQSLFGGGVRQCPGHWFIDCRHRLQVEVRSPQVVSVSLSELCTGQGGIDNRTQSLWRGLRNAVLKRQGPKVGGQLGGTRSRRLPGS